MYYRVEKNKMYAVICAGQSNEAGGSTTGTNASQYLGSQRSYIFFNNNIQSYNFGVNNGESSLTSHCPQTSLGYRFTELTKMPLLMIKWAYAGSCLVDDGTSYVNGLWQIDGNSANYNSLFHYNKLVNNYLLPCIQYCESKNIELEILGFSWCQGEGDSVTQYRAENYKTHFTNLYNAIKNICVTNGVASPNFCPIITRIHNNFNAGTRPYLDLMRTNLSELATELDGYWINSDSYSLASDNIHWNASGQTQHGIDRAEILATLI